ncbi:MAG: maleylacetoacetate isomerase [Alphaproteobacteria bacterium]|nr:maleylacetoacetate isomerase [Alphaproteobacteria bacterium]
MKLYSYWRSSASWRVRIGLALKGLPYAYEAVDLLASQQKADAHAARNPMRQVPVLELDDGTRLTQSLAILGYLDHLRPDPPLYPVDALERAHAVALAEIVNAGIQPLQNLTVLGRIEALGGDKLVWGRDVIQSGLEALQAAAAPHAGTFLVGDAPTVADLCLVPQLYNARRFACDLDRLGLLTTIEARCAALPAFQAAHPDQQPDAPRSTP